MLARLKARERPRGNGRETSGDPGGPGERGWARSAGPRGLSPRQRVSPSRGPWCTEVGALAVKQPFPGEPAAARWPVCIWNKLTFSGKEWLLACAAAFQYLKGGHRKAGEGLLQGQVVIGQGAVALD